MNYFNIYLKSDNYSFSMFFFKTINLFINRIIIKTDDFSLENLDIILELSQKLPQQAKAFCVELCNY